VFALLARPSVRPSLRPARKPFAARLAVESLEDRVVLSAAAVAPVAPAVNSALADAINVTDVVLTDAGQLVANATVFGQATQFPITLAGDGDTATDILNLEIGAIHLDLLGLNVDTSDICLDITAQPGPGNLLGNLLSGVAGALDSGTPLGDILGDLSADDLETLTTGLTDLLNGVFDAVLSSGGTAGGVAGAAAQQAGSTTDILNLSLGPVSLNLLGLQVDLDDCDGGPVTIDVTADAGSGNLLGNLLSSVAHLLDRDPGNAINAKLNKLDKVLAKAADDLLG